MRRITKILEWALLALAVVVVGVQFVRPARTNPPIVTSNSVESHLQIPSHVATILDESCNDCHSNKTSWPWYSNVAPVSWFVIDHVNHGRSHLNFSEWGRFDRREAEEMLKEICKEVQAGAMPLGTYTPLHAGSELTNEEITILCDWTRSEQARLLANHSASN